MTKEQAHDRPVFISELGSSTATEIFVRGENLTENIMGKMDLGEMMFFLLTGKKPTTEEGKLVNAMLVALVEHGLTPSAMAARLTWLGAPENLQGAVASGLLGVGSRFVGPVDEVACVLQETISKALQEKNLENAPEDPSFYKPLAAAIVTRYREKKQIIPGIGHPIHKPDDPRTIKLYGMAEEFGLAGAHIALQKAIRREAERVFNKVLPINVTGAIGSILSDLNIPWQIARGFPLVSRCVGLVAHLREELVYPMARQLWDDAYERTVPPQY